MAPVRGLLLLTDLARLPEAEPELKVWYTRDRYVMMDSGSGSSNPTMSSGSSNAGIPSFSEAVLNASSQFLKTES